MSSTHSALEVPPMSSDRAISRLAVVVITRERSADLGRSLAQLSALPEHPALIVVDNGSHDDSCHLIRQQFPRVQLVSLPCNGGAGSRNIGVRLAGCEFIAFADDDSWWLPGSLAKAVEIMSTDPKIGLLAGRILVGPSATTDPVCDDMASGPLGENLQPTTGGRRAVTGFLACGAVVRRRAFLSIGGFSAGLLVGGEEQTVAWDLWVAGWRALYAPELVAVHFPAIGSDRSTRSEVVARNDLWATWARLPIVPAVTRTRQIVGSARQDRGVARGVGRAFVGARWALARRARLPPHIEQARNRLTVV